MHGCAIPKVKIRTHMHVVTQLVRYIDPQGDWHKDFLTGQQSPSSFQLEVGQAATELSKDSFA
jgi:hypothetical protein